MTAPGYSTVRLLSPTRRRIVTIDSARQGTDPALATNLRHAGWTDYRGSAQATKRGWVIYGTDPAVDRIANPMTQNVAGRCEWEA
jgi:hypothetical protein